MVSNALAGHNCAKQPQHSLLCLPHLMLPPAPLSPPFRQALPICFPGTAVWRGRQARFYILSVLGKAVARSKAYLQVCSITSLVSICVDKRPKCIYLLHDLLNN